jgi:hypothetical protein
MQDAGRENTESAVIAGRNIRAPRLRNGIPSFAALCLKNDRES